jgi:hypothetical protein
VFLDEGHVLVTHSLGRYGRTRPKTTASRRKVQFGPRVRADLIAQRRRVELSSPHVFPNRAGSALNQVDLSANVATATRPSGGAI